MVAVDATTGALRWKQNAQPAGIPVTSGQPSGCTGLAQRLLALTMISDGSSSIRKLINSTTGAVRLSLTLKTIRHDYCSCLC